jgi:starch phosphorylase
MCNGALTIGTMDGATVEMAEEAGLENMFIFGHQADEIQRMQSSYDPYDWVMRDNEIRKAIDLIFSGFFNIAEPHIFEPLRQALFDQGDRYFHFADLRSYANAHEQATFLYLNNIDEWARKAIINIARSGKFSSDRTITEYATRIWNVKSFPIEKDQTASSTMRSARKR